jgi:hypothetical protein
VLLLAALTALHTVAGVAVAAALKSPERVERALLAMVVAVTLVVLPIQVLGWLELLSRTNLALVAAVLGLAVAVGFGRRVDLPAALLEFLRLPLDALAYGWRVRSVAGLGVLLTLAVLLYTALAAWLAPSGAWDGLWYHEPMVGYALQNQGFAVVDVPESHAWINGYPRTSEHLMLWMVAFGDRRLIDGVPGLIAPMALLATYLLARRAGASRKDGLSAASVFFLVPGFVLQLRSTYVDVTVTAAYLAAVAFLCRARFDRVAVWGFGLSLAILGGTKMNGVAFVAALGVLGLGRGLWAARKEPRLLADFAAVLAVVLVLVAPSYLRNWVMHGNPLWPLRYESRLFGTFDGPHDFQDMQWSLGRNLHEMYGAPEPGQDYHDTKRHAYGYAFTFVGLPLFVLGLFGLVARLRTATARRTLLATVTGALPLTVSPAYYWARYQLPGPAVALAVVAAFTTRLRGFGEGLWGAMIVLGAVTLFWAEPAWDVPVRTALELLRQPPPQRIEAPLSFNFWPPPSVALRHARIGTGDVVAYGRGVVFLGNLWNEAMDNRVEYLPYGPAEEWEARLEALDPEWIVVLRGRPADRALARMEERFREVGVGHGEEVIYERLADGG